MTVRGYPLEWRQIAAWVRDNQVPADALVNVKNNQGHHLAVTGLDGDGVIQAAFRQPAVTWAELTKDLDLPESRWCPWAQVGGGDLYRIRDLGHWDAGEGEPATLVLQTRWG